MAAFQALAHNGQYNSRIFSMACRLGSKQIVNTLIDTGASVCVIAEHMLQTIPDLFLTPMAINEFGFAVMTANGSPLGLLGRVAGKASFTMKSTNNIIVSFNFDDRFRDTTLYVCRNLPTDLILSLMFMSYYDIRIVPRNKTLQWEGHEFSANSCNPGSIANPMVNPESMPHMVNSKWSSDRIIEAMSPMTLFSVTPSDSAAPRLPPMYDLSSIVESPELIDMPRGHLVCSLFDQTIGPLETVRLSIWVADLPIGASELFFSASNAFEEMSGLDLWEGLLESVNEEPLSVILTNSSIIPFHLVTGDILGTIITLRAREIFVMATTYNVPGDPSDTSSTAYPPSNSSLPDDKDLPASYAQYGAGFAQIAAEDIGKFATDEVLDAMLHEHIPMDRRENFKRLLYLQRDTFTNSFSGEPWAGGLHKIDLKANAAPYKSRCFRFSHVHMQTLKALIDKWLEEGVCIKSKSPWGASAFFVPKKEKDQWRLVVDYRELNKVTIQDRFPLPLIEDLFAKFSGSRVFSVFDGLSGFNQQGIHPDSMALTAFVTPIGLYEMTRLSMGLTNGPASYQRGMTEMGEGLHGFLNYIDDAAIHNGRLTDVLIELSFIGLHEWDQDIRQDRSVPDEWDIHYLRVKAFLIKCQEWRLRLKPQKCKIGAPSIMYLGYVIDEDGLRPNPEKVQAIQTLVAPKDAHEIRVFLGLINYYRGFIEKCSELAAPLNKLLTKGIKYLWTALHESSFVRLKEALAADCLRNHFDNTRECELYTDCSDYACGAVLSQKDEANNDRVLGYFSKTLSLAERNYSVYQKECLAILRAIEFFKQYLQGTHFTVYTDHFSLASILNWKDPPMRIARWLQIFGEYCFTAKYKRGSTHYQADAMSRLESLYVRKDCSKGAVEVNNLDPLSPYHHVNIDDDDLPSSPEVAVRTPLGIMKAMSVILIDIDPLDMPSIASLEELAEPSSLNEDFLVAMINDGPQYAETDDLLFVSVSKKIVASPISTEIENPLSADHAFQFLGRIYQDKEDLLYYRINDVWYDDSIQQFVIARLPSIPGPPTIAAGSLDHDEQGESILLDSVIRDCKGTTAVYHSGVGIQSLVDELFRTEVTDCINKWLAAKDLSPADIFALEDDEGMSHFYRRHLNSDTQEESYQLIISDGASGLVVRSHLLHACHEYCGHLRYRKMYAELGRRAWWPGMQSDCKHHASTCGPCQARGTANDRRIGHIPILQNPSVYAPFETVSIDILGPFPASSTGMTYVITAVDHFSKWLEGEAMASSPTAIDVNTFMLEHFYLRHGAVGTILADNGSNLTVNELNSSMFTLLGARIRNTTAYHPAANGQVERFNKPIADYISIFCNDKEQKDWSNYLDATIHALNTSVSTTTGYSPYYLIHGREANRVIDFRLPKFPTLKNKSYQKYSDEIQQKLLHAHLVAKSRTNVKHSLYNQPRIVYSTASSLSSRPFDLEEENPLMQARQNSTQKFSSFKPLDWVLIYTPVLQGKASDTRARKLQKFWRGPAQIEKKINDTTYMVNLGNRSQPIHLSRMKPFRARLKYTEVPF